MNTIHYKILRYLPDRVAGEFVNLGVVVFDPKNQILKSKFITEPANLLHFFPNINRIYLIESIKTIQHDLKIFSARLVSEFPLNKAYTIDQITRSILAADDSALFFSETRKTLDDDISLIIEDLFSRFVKLTLDEQGEEMRMHQG